jgi:hypothetical protein
MKMVYPVLRASPLRAQFSQTRGRTLPGCRLYPTRGQHHGTAHIARDRQPSASGASGALSIASSSSPSSNRNLNCSGFLYGPPIASDLGGIDFDRFAVSRSIGQPLANDAPDRALGTLNVINPVRNPVVVSEIELGQITMKVFLVHMLVGADQPALENREEPFKGVGVRLGAIRQLAHPLLFG